MLSYLNSCELTGPMKYKDKYVPSKNVLIMPLSVTLWCPCNTLVFSHFVLAF